jgi:hypothetical protein
MPIKHSLVEADDAVSGTSSRDLLSQHRKFSRPGDTRWYIEMNWVHSDLLRQAMFRKLWPQNHLDYLTMSAYRDVVQPDFENASRSCVFGNETGPADGHNTLGQRCGGGHDSFDP